MDHAEVLERIEAAVAGPGGLARLGADASPEAAAVRGHVAGCQPCAAEWRAWSVVSLGLAAAAPDTLEPRPELRERVLAAAAARPQAATSVPATTAARAPVSPVPDPAPAIPPARSGIRMGPRRQRDVPATPAPASAPAGLSFRWLLLGAAAVVVLLVAGMVVGRQLVSNPEAPRGDPGRILAEAATILQGGGFGLAR